MVELPKSVIFENDAELLKAVAKASLAAYDSDDSAMPSNCTKLEKHKDYVVWHVKDKGIVIAFRGTEENNFADLLHDANQFSRERVGKNGETYRVVCGYYNRASSHPNVLKKYAAMAVEKNVKLYLCGHSLGGAECTIQTLTALEKDPNVQALFEQRKLLNVTFGAPIVGDGRMTAYVKKYKWDSIFINVVHVGDWIVFGSRGVQKFFKHLKHSTKHGFKYLASLIALDSYLPGIVPFHDEAMFGTYLVFDQKHEYMWCQAGKEDVYRLQPTDEAFAAEVSGDVILREARKGQTKYDDKYHGKELYFKNTCNFLDENKAEFKKREAKELMGATRSN